MSDNWKLTRIELELKTFGEFEGEYVGRIGFKNGDNESFDFKIRPGMAQPYIDLISASAAKAASIFSERPLVSSGSDEISEKGDSDRVEVTGEGFQPVPEEAFASADRHDTNDLIADTLAFMGDLEKNGDDLPSETSNDITTDKDGKITDWGDQKPKSCDNCHFVGKECTYDGPTKICSEWKLKQ